MYKLLNDDGVDVVILDTEIEVPNHSHLSSINDVNPNSLIAIMYPQKENFSKELSDYSSKNNCIIYYPWS